VARIAAGSPEAQEIDTALKDWRQGDVALDVRFFVHVGDPAMALSEATGEAEDEGPQAVESEVAGVVVVTQTCDIVRSCVDRPYVEVAPLLEVDQEVLRTVKQGKRPLYALVPPTEGQRLVADLDRTMTVEKSIVATWKRTPGCTTDAETRAFAQALARKRVRFAFPDDFNELAKKLQSRLVDKHDKRASEGDALRALREIRVSASPSWDAEEVEVLFWFIREDGQETFEGTGWEKHVVAWLELMKPAGRFTQVEGEVTTLNKMRADDYVESDPLDLDHLSSRTR
jgi:hypothetical protein